MKTAPAGLTDELYLQAAHRPADLVTLELAVGTVRWTSADRAITYSGTTWTPGAVLDEIQVRSTLSLEVDSVSVRLGAAELVSGTPVVRRALRGELRGVRVLVQRAFVTAAGVVAGLDTVFDGAVVEVEPASTEVVVTAKSVVYRIASGVIPSRPIQPGCPYQVYSTQCRGGGAAPAEASFTNTTTVASGSTTERVRLAAASANATVSGWIRFTSGALSGQRHAVVEVISTTEVRVAVPLDSAPVAGDGVKVIRGCDKTRATCSSVFSNVANFGGFPDAPREDVAR